MTLASDFIDLLANGDEQKIKCVLVPTLGGTIGSAVLFSGTGLGAAVAAVLGGLATYAVAYKMCGAETTKGSFGGRFTLSSTASAGRLPATLVEEYENNLMAQYGISATQARFVSKAALVYVRSGGILPSRSLSPSEGKNAVRLLLHNAGLES